MTIYQMALTTLCEFAACVLLIIAYIKQDKLRKLLRGAVHIVAVYIAVLKLWRKERRSDV